MILFKNDTIKIKAEKNDRGLYDVIQYTKKIFGNSYESMILKKDLQLKDIKILKNML